MAAVDLQYEHTPVRLNEISAAERHLEEASELVQPGPTLIMDLAWR